MFMQEKILLVDHRQPNREVLRLYLNRYPREWTIVSEVDRADLESVMAQIEANEPKILILHRQTAGASLQALLEGVCARHPALRVLVTGAAQDEANLLMQWGADAFVFSADPPSTLLTRLRVLRFDDEWSH